MILFAANKLPLLRFFRFNDPYRLIGVLMLMVIMALPLLIFAPPVTMPELKSIVLGEALNQSKTMYLQLIDDTPWLAAQFHRYIELIFGRSLTARHIVALVVLFFQAGFFSMTLIRSKAYNENNYFAALIFGVLCFFSFDVLSASNELFGSTFLLLALNNLFKEIEFKVQRDETILNTGFYLGVASLLVFSYILFFLGSLIILLTYARLDLRKGLMLLFGFLLPHTILLNYYYFIGGLPQLISFFYASNFSFHSVSLISWSSIFWLGSGLTVLFVFSMIMLNREAHFTRYQSQLLQVMLVWLLIAFTGILFSSEITPHSFITFIPSTAYFISHYLLLIRRKWIAEIMLWIFILSTGIISMTARLNRLPYIDYSKMWVKENKFNANLKEKKVVVVGDALSLYQSNRMAAGFLNWRLSENIFNLENYYGDLALISDSFEWDMPDVIVDENNKMDKIFSRLPALKKKYRKNGSFYEKIKTEVNSK